MTITIPELLSCEAIDDRKVTIGNIVTQIGWYKPRATTNLKFLKSDTESKACTDLKVCLDFKADTNLKSEPT